jgi:hypothetical protein
VFSALLDELRRELADVHVHDRHALFPPEVDPEARRVQMDRKRRPAVVFLEPFDEALVDRAEVPVFEAIAEEEKRALDQLRLEVIG